MQWWPRRGVYSRGYTRCVWQHDGGHRAWRADGRRGVIACKTCGFDNEAGGAASAARAGGSSSGLARRPRRRPPPPRPPPTPAPQRRRRPEPSRPPHPIRLRRPIQPSPSRSTRRLICPSCGLANPNAIASSADAAPTELVPVATEPIGPATVVHPAFGPARAGRGRRSSSVRSGSWQSSGLALRSRASSARDDVAGRRYVVAQRRERGTLESSSRRRRLVPSRFRLAVAGDHPAARADRLQSCSRASSTTTPTSSSVESTAVGDHPDRRGRRRRRAAGLVVATDSRIAWAQQDGIRIANADGTGGDSVHQSRRPGPETGVVPGRLTDRRSAAVATSDFDIYLAPRRRGRPDQAHRRTRSTTTIPRGRPSRPDRVRVRARRGQRHLDDGPRRQGPRHSSPATRARRTTRPGRPTGRRSPSPAIARGTFFIYVMNADGTASQRLAIRVGRRARSRPGRPTAGSSRSLAPATRRIAIVERRDGTEVGTLPSDDGACRLPRLAGSLSRLTIG